MMVSFEALMMIVHFCEPSVLTGFFGSSLEDSSGPKRDVSKSSFSGSSIHIFRERFKRTDSLII